jgi:hypothetical protein
MLRRLRPEAGVTVRTRTGMNRALDRARRSIERHLGLQQHLVQFPPLVTMVRLRAHSSAVMWDALSCIHWKDEFIGLTPWEGSINWEVWTRVAAGWCAAPTPRTTPKCWPRAR